jgi:hypothetical protein
MLKMADMSWRGLDTLTKQLMAPQVRRVATVIRPGLLAGLQPIMAQAVATAPRRTGRLASSFVIRGGGVRGFWVRARLILAKVEYAGVETLGTSRRPADDFLARAVEDRRDAAIRVASDVIQWQLANKLGI